MADVNDGFPIHKAVFDNDLQTLSRLLRKHDVAAKDNHGNTALHLAVMLGRKECVQLLLKHDAPVKVKNGLGWTVLAEAVSYGNRPTSDLEGIASSQPQASTQAYRPPSARNRPAVKFSLHDDEESAHKPGADSTPSKAALKQKKKRDAKKAKKLEGGEEEPKGPAVASSVQINLTGDPELDKKLKNIKKKLDAIEKLKQQQAQGKTLEINQMEKIKGEAELLEELKNLSV